MVYGSEFGYLQDVAKSVGVAGEFGTVVGMAWVPIHPESLAIMVRDYGEQYAQCTHWLLFATTSAEYGDQVTTLACASDGSAPYDTPFYEVDVTGHDPLESLGAIMRDAGRPGYVRVK